MTHLRPLSLLALTLTAAFAIACGGVDDTPGTADGGHSHDGGDDGHMHGMDMGDAGMNMDLSTTQTTAEGTYALSYTSYPTPLDVGAASLTVTVTRTDGAALASDLTLAFDAAMPAHGHGMVGADIAVTDQGAGTFEVTGLDFVMPGHWELYLDVTAGGVTERATFNVMIEG